MAATNPLFISKGKDTRIVIQSATPKFLADGSVRYIPGKTVEFKSGMFEVNDAEAKNFGMSKGDLAAKIRESPLNGAFIFEKGKEPGAPAVPMEDMLEKVGAAAAKQNVKTLQGLLEEEQANDAREPVLGAIRVALGALGDIELGKRPPGRPKPPVVEA